MNYVNECKILIIDDTVELLEMVKQILFREGFKKVLTASTCKEAEEVYAKENPELIILDVCLPDGDGFGLIQKFHAVSEVPVLFLSARDEDNDRLLGLGLGADDYMTKPFLPKELVLRMTAIIKRSYFSTLRKAKEDSEERVLTLGSRTVDFSRGTVLAEGSSIPLTAKELGLLEKLKENRGKIVTFDALCQSIWGDSYYGYENTLMVHIRRLREKIEENPSAPNYLLTVRGLGYKLKE